VSCSLRKNLFSEQTHYAILILGVELDSPPFSVSLTFAVRGAGVA